MAAYRIGQVPIVLIDACRWSRGDVGILSELLWCLATMLEVGDGALADSVWAFDDDERADHPLASGIGSIRRPFGPATGRVYVST
ncbi:hypothetical protein [Micromonospora sp. WMMD1274]|uniref:hypothetical protein n=1 Tax=Micromonospora sp. WMMD1274 TaxID=3404116 RepID=UPI003B9256D5